MSRLERGQRGVSLVNLEKLAAALGARMADILGRVPDQFSLGTRFWDQKQSVGAVSRRYVGGVCPGLLPPVRVVVHDDRPVGVRQEYGGVGLAPVGIAAGQPDKPPRPCGQTPDLTAGVARRENSGRCGRAHRPGENPRAAHRRLNLAL